MSEEMLYIFEGRAIRDVEAVEYPILAAGLVAANAIHVFETKETFEDWAKSTRYAETIDSITNKIIEAKRYESADTSSIRIRQQKVIDRISEDIDELAERTGLYPASLELFLKATIDSDVLEGPIFDPITFWDGIGSPGGISGTGSWFHLPGGFWPDLGWFGWNDRISSVRISGFATLYQNSWWGGRNVWLAGHPVWFYDNLANLGFDNTASSAVVA